MKDYLRLNFKEGLDYIVKTVMDSDRKPTIVAILGPANSGKSELRFGAHRLLGIHGKTGLACMEGHRRVDLWSGEVCDLDYVLL